MVEFDTNAILKQRDFFPRGMVQPEGGYRFSLDSLLLACFVHPGRRHSGLDLGCGCGVVGLAMLLRRPDLKILGVESEALSVECARENSVRLHFSSMMNVTQGDVKEWRPDAVVDFVVSNPPYRKLGQGRVSQGESRQAARFEGKGDFAGFARCAALALKTRGKFTFVHLPERIPELLAVLSKNGLEPKRMRMVHGRADENATMVLIEAIKAGGGGLIVEPPLVLHQGHGKQTQLTEQVLEFCPFLRSKHEGSDEHE
ncbi:tRNA1(Val) (adenine(37)-N6)-methyltransferase [Pseudodesulfovibrio piezophilus]|uniref:Methyltransferase small n=1 Tax=Pseudodesulfovibrio piezophilus (strain DSM 21447 / JCM 15486 / C1TLV30) TaxID=1322246 RepID=M1WMG5_PSEP2|nr:methyltransferase [Pseudodesulfovibrio piezophilus]CCH49565.1 Methyltransferase small [Pseudodesulfovibrio piezophilus C1TLV30]